MPPEKITCKRSRMKQIVSLLKSEYPDSKCSLEFKSPFQLLVATVLSAQCTDERVNRVVVPLFRKHPDPKSFTQLTVSEIGREIFSTGFYNNKAKSVKGLSHMLVEKFKGIVPDNMEDLVSLPGVGRKTANVVLGNIFKIPGIVVDTHVMRIANLLGFTKSRNAVIIERQLEKIIAKKDWTLFTHLIIDHGRAVCIANRPQCVNCIISDLCPSSK